MFRILNVTFVALLLISFAAGSAKAVTYRFEATATSISPILALAGFSAATLSGQFTFEPNSPGMATGNFIGNYDMALTDFSFSDPSSENTASSSSGRIQMLNGFGIPGNVVDSFSIFISSSVIAPLVHTTNATGYRLSRMDFVLADPGQSAFSGIALPGTLSSDAFQTRILVCCRCPFQIERPLCTLCYSSEKQKGRKADVRCSYYVLLT